MALNQNYLSTFDLTFESGWCESIFAVVPHQRPLEKVGLWYKLSRFMLPGHYRTLAGKK